MRRGSNDDLVDRWGCVMLVAVVIVCITAWEIAKLFVRSM